MTARSVNALPIDHCVIFLLGKAFQRVTQEARDRLAVHGVSPMQYIVLSALWESDGSSGAQLTARLRIDSATITGIIDRLVAADLAARVADADDRRVQRVRLTAKGRSLRRPLETAMIDVNREIAAELGPRAKAFWATLADVGTRSLETKKPRTSAKRTPSRPAPAGQHETRRSPRITR